MHPPRLAMPLLASAPVAAIAPGAKHTPCGARRTRFSPGTSHGGLVPPQKRAATVKPSAAGSDHKPNATWDEESQATGLSAQIRTTNTLREALSANLFDVDVSLVDADVVYTSQVHSARGKKLYAELMREWKPLVKRNLQSFTYDCERAFCPEPGVLLVRWRAEWDGAFNADAAMVEFIETNFPEYDDVELGRLKRDVEGTDRKFSGDREYDVRGITTVRVNQQGKVVMHSDRIVEKGEFLPPVEVSEVWDDASDDAARKEEDEKDEIAARDEFATTVFYNALKPPGVSAAKWFFDVLLELEWQYFRKQVGDDTGVIGSKDEFVNTIITLLITVVVLPSAIITWAVLTSLTTPGGLLGPGGDEYDQLITRADAQDRATAVRNGEPKTPPEGVTVPALDADLLRSLWGAKIGL